MNVGNLFQRLSYGEFNDLSIGMEGAGSIEPAERDKVVSHINVTLTELFTKFIHKRDYLVIQLQEGVTRYSITPAHTVTTDPSGYILDSFEMPFLGDLVKILGMTVLDDPSTTLNENQTLFLNRRNPSETANKLITLDYRTIYIPNPEAGCKIQVEYQASHPRLTIPADLTEEIQIHPVLESALEAHVAYQSFGAMNGEAHLAKSRLLWGRYQQICDRVKLDDLLQESQIASFDRLRDKGFI